ncbi:MAG: SusC/RagA family TonB-linked outer membrane protein [Cyclobacteriaceae bacterium]|nr:MAG: SusC/RagA family TonB-linked outer membrane protein [Cyclobacteriaceae bacterium]
MKIKLLRITIMAIKFSAYHLVAQILCLSVVYAYEVKAQYKSAFETYVDFQVEDNTVGELIEMIESNTDFGFYYLKKDLNKDLRISLDQSGKKPVTDILLAISKEAKVKFRQVNNNISISRISKSDLQQGVQNLEVLIQEVNVSGKVSGEDAEGIPGVNILVKGTTLGTVTDANGDYNIEVPDRESILVFSSVGYLTHEILVGDQNQINVTLMADIQALEEVVVIGYGTAKKSDLTGALSQVTSEDFRDQPITRIEQGLQGRAAGVTVQQNSGSPGGEIRVRIRGANSISGNNDPLIVIDNIIGGDLNSINPNEIASMEVLKDASATAIYGSRGSNGVILITTKIGSGTPAISVDNFTSFSSLPNKIDVLSAGDFARIQNTVTPGVYSDAEISSLDANGGTDWQDELYQSAITNITQLSASGKEGKLGYFLSLGYLDQDGILETTEYQRLNVRTNFNMDFSEKFKVALNLYGSSGKHTNNQERGGSTGTGLVTGAVTWDPTTPVRDENGDYNYLSEKSVASLAVNPVSVLEQLDARFNEDKLNMNLNLSYDILDELNYTAVIGLGYVNVNNEVYEGVPNNAVGLNPPRSSYTGIRSTNYQVSNILTWDKDFGGSNVKLTGVYEVQGLQNRINGLGASDYPFPAGYYLMELALNQGISADFNESAIESFMGRGTYSYDDKLFVTGTIRVDKSSRFRPDNNTGTFPSVAVAYSFRDMPFVVNSNLFSNIKVRAGWGQVGNQDIPPYSTWPTVKTGVSYSFDGTSMINGTDPGNFGNTDLTWETTTQTNLGLDFSFLDYRLNLSLDAYKKNTTDLLLNTPVPNYAGGGIIPKNVGEVENKGIDIELSGVVINKGNLTWESKFNFSFFDQEVVKLDEDQEFIPGSFINPDGSNAPMNRVILGEPLGMFWGKQFLGTWKTSEESQAALVGQQPGDAKYLRDSDGALVNVAIGNGLPTTSWGFNNTLTYKNWDMNVFFRGVHGNEILNITRGTMVGFIGKMRSTTAPESLNHWTPENETEIPVPGSGANFTASSRYVEDGSYIKLENVSVGYTLHDLFGFARLTVLLSGQNLFTISDFSGYDPEVSSTNIFDGNSDQIAGINTGAYPRARTFTIGVKLGF